MARHYADGVRGSSGNLVFYVRKGVQCSRVKAANFNDAKTPGQIAHREKMRRTASVVSKCSKAISIGYQAADKDSASNEIRSFIMKNCFVQGESLPELDYSKIAFSRGSIAPPRNTTLTIDGSSATVTWENIKLENESLKLDDKVIVVLYTDENYEGYSHFVDDLGTRKDLKAIFHFSPKSKPLHAWMFFSNSDNAVGESRKKISNSVYLGIIAQEE